MSELYHAQYRDVNIGPAHYKSLEGDLLVTKIFGVTLQGEGPYAGWPAIFVRLAGCNRGDKTIYGCQFCDTNFLFADGKRMSISDIVGAIGNIPRKPYVRPLIVISGGEPMMQDSVTSLTAFLINAGWRVQLESNGDRIAGNFLNNPFCKEATLVVSPKIVTKRGAYAEIAGNILHRADALKYLVDHRVESPYNQLPVIAFDKIIRNKVYVSPITVYKRTVAEGEVASIWKSDLIDQELTRKNHNYAAQLCMENGFKLSVQKHLYIEAE